MREDYVACEYGGEDDHENYQEDHEAWKSHGGGRWWLSMLDAVRQALGVSHGSFGSLGLLRLGAFGSCGSMSFDTLRVHLV